MGAIDDAAQKMKGKMQQTKGEAEIRTGNNIKGVWDKTKGKINESLGDTKLQRRDDSSHITDEE